MKKILVAILMTGISLSVSAQMVIPRTDNISVSSTIVTKKKTVFLEKGFQQFVELGSKISLGDSKGATGANYIGGYRFNNYFYAGAGVGLEFAHDVAEGVKENVGESLNFYYSYSSDEEYVIMEELGINQYGLLNTVAVPLYLHLRGYYMIDKWTPYSSLSIGGILAPKENGFYADFSTGVDLKVYNKFNIYLAAGIYYRIVRDTDLEYSESKGGYRNYERTRTDDCSDSNCPYYDSYYHTRHYHSHAYDLYNSKIGSYGISVHLGISF